MTLVNEVFIVIQVNNIGETMIESVWSTLVLAQAAKYYHAEDSKLPIDTYFVITREINKAKAKQ